MVPAKEGKVTELVSDYGDWKCLVRYSEHIVTVGLGRCEHRLPYLNLGGGIKIELKDKLGIRVECRWWNADDVSLISVLGGISYSF